MDSVLWRILASRLARMTGYFCCRRTLEVEKSRHKTLVWLRSAVIPLLFTGNRHLRARQPKSSAWTRKARAGRYNDYMHGFHGRYLRVDLTAGQAAFIPLAESVLRRFLGGVGLAAYLIHRESRPGLDPLAAEAPLIF